MLCGEQYHSATSHRLQVAPSRDSPSVLGHFAEGVGQEPLIGPLDMQESGGARKVSSNNLI